MSVESLLFEAKTLYFVEVEAGLVRQDGIRGDADNRFVGEILGLEEGERRLARRHFDRLLRGLERPLQVVGCGGVELDLDAAFAHLAERAELARQRLGAHLLELGVYVYALALAEELEERHGRVRGAQHNHQAAQRVPHRIRTRRFFTSIRTAFARQTIQLGC